MAFWSIFNLLQSFILVCPSKKKNSEWFAASLYLSNAYVKFWRPCAVKSISFDLQSCSTVIFQAGEGRPCTDDLSWIFPFNSGCPSKINLIFSRFFQVNKFENIGYQMMTLTWSFSVVRFLVFVPRVNHSRLTAIDSDTSLLHVLFLSKPL